MGFVGLWMKALSGCGLFSYNKVAMIAPSVTDQVAVGWRDGTMFITGACLDLNLLMSLP